MSDYQTNLQIIIERKIIEAIAVADNVKLPYDKLYWDGVVFGLRDILKTMKGISE